ncbi:hypothetical protein EXE43_08885 [Halorubrum sp. SS5]|nr:hypothetical protein EXE43_08885 [Halorubrum sp. SS5]
MKSNSGRPGEIDISLWSILGALAGGFVGSIASQAVAGNPVFNFVTIVIILLTGVAIGVLVGVVFHDSIRDWYSVRQAERVELAGKVSFSGIGVLIMMIGLVLLIIAFSEEVPNPVGWYVSGVSISIMGSLIMLIPFISEDDKNNGL